jgi:transporter family-2 protein
MPRIRMNRRIKVSGLVFFVAVAAVGGVAVTLQAQFMGLMDRGLGTLESVGITYGSGGLLIGLTLLALRGGNLAAWQSVPRYSLLAGLAGLVIVGTIGFSVQRLGLAGALPVVVAAEFFSAAIVSHFGLFGAEARPLDWPRLAGMGLLLAGTWLILQPR